MGDVNDFVGNLLGDHIVCFATLGFVYVTYIVLKVTNILWQDVKTFFLAKKLGLTVDHKSLGEWAVITGATDGIGKYYARALAKKGMNIFLISRTQAKLEKVAGEIEADFKVKTKCLAINFFSGPEIYDTIRKALDGYEIGILFNNVGTAYPRVDYFHLHEEQVHKDIMNCNTLSVMMMTHIVLPEMLRRGRGAVVNNAAFSAFTPVPLLSVYSASKSFVNFITIALKKEYQKKGILFQSVCPFFVSTNMTKLDPSPTVPDAESYANSLVDTLGVVSETTGMYRFAILVYLARLMGWEFFVKVFGKTLRRNRRKAYKQAGKPLPEGYEY